MKKVIPITIILIIIVISLLFALYKLDFFTENGPKLFSSNKETYEKPEINKDYTFIEAYETTYELGKKELSILAYYYYDEVDTSKYEYNEETDEEKLISESHAYYLIRELYINGKEVGHINKLEYSDDNDLKSIAKEDFNSIEYNTLNDMVNDDKYLVIKYQNDIMNNTLSLIKTYQLLILNEDIELLQKLDNGSNIGYVNIPIYKDELEDRTSLKGIATFNKMFDTDYDYLLYSENGYSDVLKNKIYYIDVNASKCEIDEHMIQFKEGELLDSYVKTYPDVSKYVTGEEYC